MNTQIKLYLDAEVANFKSRRKLDPFSTEFVFGHNEEYTRLRNHEFVLGPNGPVTILTAMLRYGLDDTNRINLFPSIFDLGSPKQIPKSKLTLVCLAKKVREERKLLDDLGTRRKEFESVTGKLRKITGRRFGEYENKQNALRVIYLLDRMMINPKYADHGRSKRLLTLIKPPSSKFSFELRSEYPALDSEENTFLLNDLKAYLGIEIDAETLSRIDSVFKSLINRFDEVREHLDQVAYSLGEKTLVAGAYQKLQALVEAIGICHGSEPSNGSARLDQDLYFHLNRIELLHYVGGLDYVLDRARPPSTITPIKEEMIAAFSAFMGTPQTYGDITIDRFLFPTFSILAKGLPELFLHLIGKALGHRPSILQYARVISLAEELLYRTKRFGGDGLLLREEILFSFRNIVSALCAVAQAIKFTTKYRPWIFGDNGQSRSIITPLGAPLDREGSARSKEIPEGYLQIWHNRREWVQDALEGGQDAAALKFGLRKILLAKVVECVSVNDIAMIEERLSTLHARLFSIQPTDLHA